MYQFLVPLVVIAASYVSLSGAISGNIFYSDLKPAEMSIIRINTSPSQIYVSVTGAYFFNAEPGTYTLSIQSKRCNHTLEAEVGNGSYVRDIILPCRSRTLNLIPIVGIAVLASASAIAFLPRRRKEMSEDGKAVIDALGKEKRMLQKDLRRVLGWSETKLSLVLAELESEGAIKKIKKGRTNIIVLRR